MLSNCKDAMDNSPIIAAIKDMAGLKKCLTCDSQVIFILFGDICNIADIVDSFKAAGKTAMVHIDLINGLSGKEIAVDFIRKYTHADGIITTKPVLIAESWKALIPNALRHLRYQQQMGLLI